MLVARARKTPYKEMIDFHFQRLIKLQVDQQIELTDLLMSHESVQRRYQMYN